MKAVGALVALRPGEWGELTGLLRAPYITGSQFRWRLPPGPEPPMSPRKRKRVALYLRVSTSEQTTRNQRRELHAVAERHGWEVVTTYEDAGVSGAKGRDKRRGFDRLMIAVTRRGRA